MFLRLDFQGGPFEWYMQGILAWDALLYSALGQHTAYTQNPNVMNQRTVHFQNIYDTK